MESKAGVKKIGHKLVVPGFRLRVLNPKHRLIHPVTLAIAESKVQLKQGSTKP